MSIEKLHVENYPNLRNYNPKNCFMQRAIRGRHHNVPELWKPNKVDTAHARARKPLIPFFSVLGESKNEKEI
jgi:hypothetical protein